MVRAAAIPPRGPFRARRLGDGFSQGEKADGLRLSSVAKVLLKKQLRCAGGDASFDPNTACSQRLKTGALTTLFRI